MPIQPTLTIVSTAPVLNLSDALALNDRGQVAGQEDTVFPFIWTPTVPNGTTGTSLRLPLLPIGGGPAPGTVTAINANGDAVGFAEALDPNGLQVTRAVLWPASGGVFYLGTLIPSLAPPGFLGSSRAFDINDNGIIVGVSDSLTAPGVQHAFRRDPAVGVMVDLGSLVPLTPSRALNINNTGTIVGEATTVDGAGNPVSRALCCRPAR
jgi:probable HAF family extracellular repeat protein